jgi:type II secretory pathway pseudopilin PulG
MKTNLLPLSRVRGMTLLEMTVVILVILGLMGILIVSGRSWMLGTNRSGCIMNIRNMQNAVRAYQNTNQLSEGVSLNVSTDLIGPGKYILDHPKCPGGGHYTPLNRIPAAGQLVMSCDLETILGHQPTEHEEW